MCFPTVVQCIIALMGTSSRWVNKVSSFDVTKGTENRGEEKKKRGTVTSSLCMNTQYCVIHSGRWLCEIMIHLIIVHFKEDEDD